MNWFRRIRAFMTAHPKTLDGSIALIIFVVSALSSQTSMVAGLRSDHGWLFFLFVSGMTLPLVWRRVRPDLVFAACLASFLAFWAFEFEDVFANYSTFVAVYSIAAYMPRRRAIVRTLAIVGVGLIVSIPITIFIDPPDSSPVSIATTCVFFLCAWLWGRNTRLRRSNLESLRIRAEQAEFARDQEVRNAAQCERTRIAREMHDIVAHSMSVMVVQAGGARKLLNSDPKGATDALLAVESIGREGLVEMRRLLGVLRSDENEGGRLAPQPTLASLDELVAHSSSDEFAINLHIDGDVQEVAQGVDVSAYRIIQEALTNVHKHAGAATVDVRVQYEPQWITLTVADNGRGAAHNDGDGGHGLIGMRERVEVYGGEFSAGPQRGGGFAVKARLPIDGECQ